MTKQKILSILEGKMDNAELAAMKKTAKLQDASDTTVYPARPATETGIEEYQGTWGYEQAFHLLSRTTFGPTRQMIQDAVDMGMDATVDKLLEDFDLPEPPVNFNYVNDPFVALGETWVEAKYFPGDQIARNTRQASMRAWQIGQILKGEFSAREKMTLFWHNHYVTSMEVVIDPKFIYKNITLLRENAFGNFREMTKLITVDPTMLRYLNGQQNRVGAPNENYARELLELFSIGKGPLVGPGDYTNYTEHDIAEAAKILTGWVTLGFFDNVGQAVGSDFRPARHDTTTKKLSERFNFVEIENAGPDEYKNFIDIIYQNDECARFLVRKLYKWFVYYEISEEEETNVILPLADELVGFDYDVREVLRIMFKSEHFYDALNCGCIIKSPMDYTLNLFNQFEIPLASDLLIEYRVWLVINNFIELNQMSYFAHPSVAGWKAYYQEPSYNRIWVNSVTLPFRMTLTDIMSLFGFDNDDGEKVVIDILKHVEGYENALDPNALIEEAISILCPKQLTDNQKTYLKEQLIPGLPDFEWTVEYGEYLADPDDPDLKASIELKLRLLFRTLLLLPEYHLS